MNIFLIFHVRCTRCKYKKLKYSNEPLQVYGTRLRFHRILSAKKMKRKEIRDSLRFAGFSYPSGNETKRYFVLIK